MSLTTVAGPRRRAALAAAFLAVGVVTGCEPGTPGLPARIALSKDRHDFGRRMTGALPAPVELTLTNTGAVSAEAVTAALLGDAADFVVDASDCEGRVLAGGEACVVRASFSPVTTGGRAVSLSLISGPQLAAVALVGQGVFPSALYSTAQVPDGGILADGEAAAELRVTLLDADALPVPGAPVSITATGSDHVIEPAQASSGPDGVVTATVRSTRAEEKLLTITAGAFLLSPAPAVRFVPLPPFADLSELVASPQVLVADGSAATTVVVRLKDPAGQPLEGRPVILFSDEPLDQFVQPGRTDASGEAAGTVRTTRAGRRRIHARVDDAPIPNFAEVDFVAGAAAATTVTAARPEALADGIMEVEVQLSVRDGHGNPVPGVLPSLAASGAGNQLRQPLQPTDAAGTTRATLASTTAGVKSLTAVLEGALAQPATVRFFTPPAVTSVALWGHGCTTIRYTVQQVEAQPVDVLVRYTVGAAGPLRTPTPAAGSQTTTNVPTSPGGVSRTLTWNAAVDAPGQTFETWVTVTPILRGMTGTASADAGIVSNALRARPFRGPAHAGWPTRLVTGDFDLDGVPDVAAANLGGTVSFFAGRPDGGLAPRVDVGVVPYTDYVPADLAAGDVDRDGRLDLILVGSVNVSSGGQVAFGTGDGGFAPIVSLPLSGYPWDVEVADFDGDGPADVLLRYDTGLQLLRGAGDGGFTPLGPFDAGVGDNVIGRPSTTARDFDGDGVLDLLVVDDRWLAVHPGVGDGTFGPPGITPWPRQSQMASSTVGDFDGDGRADVVGTDGRGATWFHGLGDGTFAPPAASSELLPMNGFPRLSAADLDGDGRDDVLNAGYSRSGTGERFLAVLLSLPDGGHPPAAFAPTSGYLEAPAVALDLDGDGRLDLVHATSDTLDVVINEVATPCP